MSGDSLEAEGSALEGAGASLSWSNDTSDGPERPGLGAALGKTFSSSPKLIDPSC